LVIELDGGLHSVETDTERSRLIEASGYLVIRFWNNDVNDNIEGVLARILATLRADAPHPNPLPHGERE
jgi:very-short-patch-repair endonuclease